MYYNSSIPRNMLEIIMGCMFSGKSTEVIRRIKRLKTLKKNVMVINHSIDTRYTDGIQGYIATHNRESEPCISTDKLYNPFERLGIFTKTLSTIAEKLFSYTV